MRLLGLLVRYKMQKTTTLHLLNWTTRQQTRLQPLILDEQLKLHKNSKLNLRITSRPKGFSELEAAAELRSSIHRHSFLERVPELAMPQSEHG